MTLDFIGTPPGKCEDAEFAPINEFPGMYKKPETADFEYHLYEATDDPLRFTWKEFRYGIQEMLWIIERLSATSNTYCNLANCAYLTAELQYSVDGKIEKLVTYDGDEYFKQGRVENMIFDLGDTTATR